MFINILSVAMETEDGGPGPGAYIAVPIRNEETYAKFVHHAGKC